MFHRSALLAVFACVLSGCGGAPSSEGRGYSPYRPHSGGVTGADGKAGAGGAAGPGGVSGCVPNRSVLVGEVINARDLGGTPLENDGAVACGQLFRGAPLANLSSQGCADFSALGIRTVIDLRTADERAVKPESPCVTDSAKAVFAPLPIPYNVDAHDYLADLDATPSIATALQTLGDEAAYPIYFHCTWGRDRTGVLGAVILLALGASRAAVLQEYSLSEATVGAYPDSLVAVLDEVERRGGIEAYFAAAGISQAQLATLRARVTLP